MNSNTDLKSKKILVLMGGWNEEREVSLDSGKAVLETLVDAGYNAHGLDLDRNFITKISKIKPDIVFIALHGKVGEDGRIQALLDFMQIPYTHSSFLSSAICMNKPYSLKLVESLGLNIPKGEVLNKGGKDNAQKISQFELPFVVKPVDSGSSVGVEIITKEGQFDIEKYQWQYGDQIIVEKYIKGKEVQVAVMNGKAIGAIEIRPKNEFYNYESKYTSGMSEYIMPAEIPDDAYNESLVISEKIHNYFGCEGISRIDYRYDDEEGKFYFLELNTHPGFTENSLVPKIAKYQGISFLEIILYLLNNSKCSS